MSPNSNPNGWEWGPPKSDTEGWRWQRRNELIATSTQLTTMLLRDLGDFDPDAVAARVQMGFEAAKLILAKSDAEIPRA